MRKKERFVMFLAVLLVCCSTALVSAFTLPDTGQTKCYNTSGAEIACSGTGQDGDYNINPMSFTDNGDGTITDNVTGLMWQKGENATYYNWYVASGTYDATSNPSIQSICGSLTLGGQSGWRLPTKKELMSIVDYSISSGAAINTTYFPNAHVGYYWSSTTDAYFTDDAWVVSFGGGSVGDGDKSYDYYVRCVRGGQSSPSFTNNGNGTVTDNGTGLMWQQGEPGMKTWANALTYCEGLSLGGQSDWRLPNIKELDSLADDTISPAIDTTYFPNAHAFAYWSSTTSAYYTSPAWYVYFGSGAVGFSYKSYSGYYVRCVRGGQSGSLGTLAALTVSKAGSGNGTVTSAPSGINCGTACSASFAAGTSVTLTAAPDSGYTFTGWSGGGCSGSGTCTVTVNADLAVTATFTVIPAATNNCAASLTTELSLHIPIITYNGNSYWADFLNVPNTLNFTLINANTVSDTSPYSGCTPASLSSDSKLHVPVIMFNGASYWADFLYTGGVNFSFVNAGGN